jgi:hypothetical protein
LTGRGSASPPLYGGSFIMALNVTVEENGSEILCVLNRNGIAFMRGGFGKQTPDSVIKDIGKRSRNLNLRLGKIEGVEDQFWEDVKKGYGKGKIEIVSEGGLRVLMKK